MSLKNVKWLWLAYAPLHLWLANLLLNDNAELGHSTWVLLFSFAAQAALFLGVLLMAFLPRREVAAPYWRLIFPLVAIELVVGVVRDAVTPTDYNLSTHGFVWVGTLILALVLFAPAYYASYKLAGYSMRLNKPAGRSS